ncbi:MAG: hypothetical protein LM578_05425 [Desulfurococcaceae archaeon]|jgi:hypothetical protein|nr:hypothetical protein [Desulfurococcaceae archaeon]
MSAREPEFAIADTCFLIDWARYRHRDVLFKLFKTVFVPETILREVNKRKYNSVDRIKPGERPFNPLH